MKAHPNHVRITIDGERGAGKSTTAQLIAKALRDAGIDVSLMEIDSDDRRQMMNITGDTSRAKYVSIAVRQESEGRAAA